MHYPALRKRSRGTDHSPQARSLRPDGLFIAICFGGQTLQELRVLATAESQITGGCRHAFCPWLIFRI